MWIRNMADINVNDSTRNIKIIPYNPANFEIFMNKYSYKWQLFIIILWYKWIKNIYWKYYFTLRLVLAKIKFIISKEIINVFDKNLTLKFFLSKFFFSFEINKKWTLTISFIFLVIPSSLCLDKNGKFSSTRNLGFRKIDWQWNYIHTMAVFCW